MAAVVPYIPGAVGYIESKAAEYMARGLTDKARYYGRKVWSNLGKRKRSVGTPLGATYNKPAKRTKTMPRRRKRYFKSVRRRRGRRRRYRSTPMRKARKKIRKQRKSVVSTRYNKFNHGPFPDLYRQWLRCYYDRDPSTATAAGVLQAHTIRLNSAQPFGSMPTATHQPMWFNQLCNSSVYKEYCVVKCKVKVWFRVPAQASPKPILIICSTNEETNPLYTAAASLRQIKENGGAFTKIVQPKVDTACTFHHTFNMYPWKHMDMNSWKTEENCAAWNAEPSIIKYFHFQYAYIDGTTAISAGDFHVSMQIDQLYNLHDMARIQAVSVKT